jgi:hypothetical protein
VYWGSANDSQPSGFQLVFKPIGEFVENAATSFKGGSPNRISAAWPLVFTSLAIAFLAGCATTGGMSPILSAKGSLEPNDSTGVLARKFNASSAAAWNDSSDSQRAKTMLDDGFTLIYASCNDYFAAAGNTQRWIIVANDAVAAAGTLATSILALTHAETAATAATALATGAFLTSTNVYTKDFLFASENINSVRALVLNALTVHQQGVPVTNQLTASDATIALLDDQDYCSMPHIATLVRSAIANGNPVVQPKKTGDSGPPKGQMSGQIASTDQDVRTDLSKVLSPASLLTADQIGALYWLVEKAPTAGDMQGPICAKLIGLPMTTSPFSRSEDSEKKMSCVYQKPWKYQDQVRRALNNLSSASKLSFDNNIDKIRHAKTEITTSQIGVDGQTPDQFSFAQVLLESKSGRPSTHINVVIHTVDRAVTVVYHGAGAISGQMRRSPPRVVIPLEEGA